MGNLYMAVSSSGGGAQPYVIGVVGNTGEIVYQSQSVGNNGTTAQIAQSPDGSIIYALGQGASQNYFSQLQPPARDIVASLALPSGYLWDAFAISPLGDFALIAGVSEGSFYMVVVELSTMTLATPVMNISAAVGGQLDSNYQIAFTPTGEYAYFSCRQNGESAFYGGVASIEMSGDFALSGPWVNDPGAANAPFNAIIVSSDGDSVYCFAQNDYFVFDIESSSYGDPVDVGGNEPVQPIMSSDGSTIYLGTTGGLVAFIPLPSGTIEYTDLESPNEIATMGISSDQTTLYAGVSGGSYWPINTSNHESASLITPDDVANIWSMAVGESAALPPTVTNVSPNEGSTEGGTPVTITGTSFFGSPTVYFGENEATDVVVINVNTITCISPAGETGTVDVTVTTSFGTSETSFDDEFTYGVSPTVTNVSPNEGSTEGGTPVTITGTSFVSGESEVYFSTVPASNVSVVSDDEITCDSPPGASGVVNVTVVTPFGTSETSFDDEFTYGTIPSEPWVYFFMNAGTSTLNVNASTGTSIITPDGPVSSIEITAGTGQAIQLVPNQLIWGPLSNEGGSETFSTPTILPLTSITTTTTLTANSPPGNYVIPASDSYDINLPEAPENEPFFFFVMDLSLPYPSLNLPQLVASGSDTFNSGGSTFTLQACSQYAFTYNSSLSQWVQINYSIPNIEGDNSGGLQILSPTLEGSNGIPFLGMLVNTPGTNGGILGGRTVPVEYGILVGGIFYIVVESTESPLDIVTHPMVVATTGSVNSLQTFHARIPCRVVATTSLPSYTAATQDDGGILLTSSSDGSLTIDDLTLVVGDRFLVTAETGDNAPYNGLYWLMSAGSDDEPWVAFSTPDGYGGGQYPGATVSITSGTDNAGTLWTCTNDQDSPPVIGTDAITFVQVGSGSAASYPVITPAGVANSSTGDIFGITRAYVSSASTSSVYALSDLTPTSASLGSAILTDLDVGTQCYLALTRPLSANGPYLAVSLSASVAVYSLSGTFPDETATLLWTLTGFTGEPGQMDFSPDGSVLWVPDRGSAYVTPFDMATGEATTPVITSADDTTNAFTAKVSGDGSTVFSSGSQGLYAYDALTGITGSLVSGERPWDIICVHPWNGTCCFQEASAESYLYGGLIFANQADWMSSGALFSSGYVDPAGLYYYFCGGTYNYQIQSIGCTNFAQLDSFTPSGSDDIALSGIALG